jgi:hypothetical protein
MPMTPITTNADRKRAAYHVAIALLSDPELATRVPSGAEVTPVGFDDAKPIRSEVVVEPASDAPRALISVPERDVA